LYRWTGGSSSSIYLLVPWYLPGRIFDRDFIPLLASRIAGAVTVEEAAFKSEEDESDMGETLQKWERLVLEGDIRRNVFIGKN
jgi:hypothetical protein